MSGRLPSPHEALKAYFERVDFPYYVVTVRTADGEMSGCLAGFVTQCSIDPPNFLVCIAKVNHTFDVAERSVAMGLHLLGDEQHELARVFGEETGDLVDKFAQCDWRLGPTGAPLLVESAVSMEGSHPRPLLSRGSRGLSRCEPSGRSAATTRDFSPIEMPRSSSPGHPL